MDTINLPIELYQEIKQLIAWIDPNYIDLSYEKIQTQYHDIKKRAGELRKHLREFEESAKDDD